VRARTIAGRLAVVVPGDRTRIGARRGVGLP
jgi:hypothetical protein